MLNGDNKPDKPDIKAPTRHKVKGMCKKKAKGHTIKTIILNNKVVCV